MIFRVCAFALAVFAACLGPSGLACAADSQQPASPRHIGMLLSTTLPEEKVSQAFRQGLLDAGYAEGRDVVIEWRSANGHYDWLPQLAADLVQHQVEVIVVVGTVAAQVAKRATSTIPIVWAVVSDPVGSGLVTSLGHPGANVTGLSAMQTELSAKRLQVLKEAIPRVSRVAVLSNPDTPYVPKVIDELNAAAPPLSLELKFVGVRTPEEFDSAFSAVSRAHAQALYVIDDSLFSSHQAALLKLVSKARLPAIYWARHYAEGGGLISYGVSYGDLMRRSAGYVDRILKGAKPADLPIEQPTKFELIVNLKTAKALGITIPESVLLRADEVIR